MDCQEDIFETIRTNITATAAACDNGAAGDLKFYLTADELLPAVHLVNEKGCFIEDVSCLDAAEGFLLVYHFSHYLKPGRVVLNLLVPHETPVAPTISSVFPGANWHERECRDFFGIDFKGHPNLLPLLLPDDMEERPLLKKEKKVRISEIAKICATKDLSPDNPYFACLQKAESKTEEPKKG